jgi:hypothetical protein
MGDEDFTMGDEDINAVTRMAASIADAKLKYRRSQYPAGILVIGG